MTEKQKMTVIGFGRFGQLLTNILKSDFLVQVFDTDFASQTAAPETDISFVSLEKALENETIFYCVPISQLEKVVLQHLPIYKNMGTQKTIIDVLSVKTYPKELLSRLLPANFQILLTHPMFGPDSVKAKGLAGQTIVVDKFRTNNSTYDFWHKYFKEKHLNVVEMTAEEHDRLAARSQGLTHIIGRILEEFNFQPTIVDTLGTKKLYEIKEQTCNDTWQLFVDLQNFNPYTNEMRSGLSLAFDKVEQRLKGANLNK